MSVSGDIIAREVCDEGYVPENEDEVKMCTIETDSSSGAILVNTTGALECSSGERVTCDKNCVIIIIIVVAGTLTLVVLLLIILLLCFRCCWKHYCWRKYPVKEIEMKKT